MYFMKQETHCLSFMELQTFAMTLSPKKQFQEAPAGKFRI